MGYVIAVIAAEQLLEREGGIQEPRSASTRGMAAHINKAVEEQEDHGGVRIALRHGHDVQVVVLDVNVRCA